jgi:hypothetical protein
MNDGPDPRDPIEAWRDVSRRAAAGGYRPGRPVRATPSVVTAIGGLAVVAVLVVGSLALRGPSADPGGPIFASAEDVNFRLTLTTPRGTYGTNDSIRPVATVTYLGPLAAETVFHATSPVGFRIEEIGGDRLMGGGTRLPCRTTELARGAPVLYPFAKSGDTSSGFDETWYRDPVLRLPAGTWRIVAGINVALGDCAADAEQHQLTVENVITVTADADDPVVATAEDANIRLTLTTPHGTYRPNEAIESVATVTYLGPLDSESLFHATSPILFHVEEVGGNRMMDVSTDLPCLDTTFDRGASAAYPFRKSGAVSAPGVPSTGFDRAWYDDPILRLPAGTWRIRAELDVTTGDCGGEQHRLAAENTVTVTDESAPATPPPPTPPPPTASPISTADALAARDIIAKYEDALATGHADVAWRMLSNWSRTTVGSSTTFADAEARRRAGASLADVQIGDPTRDPLLFGVRAADLAAVADPDRTLVVGVDGGTWTENLVVAPVDGTWRIWLDTTPETYGAWPFPDGCEAFGLSARRCAAVVATAASNIAFDRSTATSTELMARGRCGVEDPRSKGIGQCITTTSFVAGVRFGLADGTSVRSDVFCGVASPSLVCSESPGIEAIDLHAAGYWDVPCAGEAPDGCASPVPLPTGAPADVGRELAIHALDIPVAPAGHREVEIGTAVLVNGVVQEARFSSVDQIQHGFQLDPGVVRMELRSMIDGRPPFQNFYERGTFDGPEEVRVLLVFDVVEAAPGGVIHVTDVLVR